MAGSDPPGRDQNPDQPRKPVDSGSMNPTCHVLIVEDDPSIRRLLHRQLASLGCSVDLACDGREALSLWERNDYDLVVTDVSMPGMDGLELASRIRGSGLRTAQAIPIIAITGHAADRDRCAAAGVTDCIGKPFSKLDLQHVLDRWVPGARDSVRRTPLRPQADVATGITAPDLSDDPEIMRGVLLTFIRTIPEYLQSLNRACAAGDQAAIVAAAHKLKSAARLVGGTEVADLCEAVEDASQEADIDLLLSLAAPIPDALKTFERSLDHALGPAETGSRTV